MTLRSIYFVLSFVLLSLCGEIKADGNVLYVENLVWDVSGENKLNICLDNNEVVNGLQFDMTLPEGIFVDDDIEIIKNKTRLGKMTVSHKEIKKNVYRFLVYSFTGDAIQGDKGFLLSVPLKLGEGVKKGVNEVGFSTISLSCVRVIPDTSYQIDDFTSTIEVK